MAASELLLGLEQRPVSAVAKSGGLVERHRAFFLTAALCHSLREADRRGGKILVGDPTEAALVTLGRTARRRGRKSYVVRSGHVEDAFVMPLDQRPDFDRLGRVDFVQDRVGVRVRESGQNVGRLSRGHFIDQLGDPLDRQ